MNDSELRQKLAAWQLPPVVETTQARAAWQALTAWRQRQTPSAPTPSAPAFPLGKPLAGMAIGVGLLLATLLVFRPPTKPTLAESYQLMSELEEFFQGHVVAVIAHDGGMDLKLADQPVPRFPDQRVVIEIAWPEQTFAIMTYSGVPICVDADHGTFCLTPLITGEGDVILLSDSGLLQSQPGLRAHAYTVPDI